MQYKCVGVRRKRRSPETAIDDKVRPSLDREETLRNAPKTDGAYFLVPRILDVD